MDKFTVKWQAEDGYVGGRPQYFNIDAADIQPGATEGEIEDLLNEMLQDDFSQKVSPEARNREDFIAWALQIAAKAED